MPKVDRCITVYPMEIRDGWFEVLWPDSISGPYKAAIRMDEVRGRWEIVELAVGSISGKRVITGEVLRQLRLAELGSVVAARWAELMATQRGGHWAVEPLNIADMDDEFRRKRAAFIAPMVEEAERQYDLIEKAAAPARYPDGHLNRVADIYKTAHAQHLPPTKAVSAELGISISAAGKQVSRARAAGLLPATTRGRVAAIADVEKP